MTFLLAASASGAITSSELDNNSSVPWILSISKKLEATDGASNTL